jgi:hypothetical protein
MDIDIEVLDTLMPVAEAEDDEYGTGKGHHTCGATWFGFNVEHCTVCHQTFSGETTGNAHRVGPHDPPGRRRCRTPAELTALGLWVETNQYGTDVWHGSPNKKGVQKRHPKRGES